MGMKAKNIISSLVKELHSVHYSVTSGAVIHILLHKEIRVIDVHCIRSKGPSFKRGLSTVNCFFLINRYLFC